MLILLCIMHENKLIEYYFCFNIPKCQNILALHVFKIIKLSKANVSKKPFKTMNNQFESLLDNRRCQQKSFCNVQNINILLLKIYRHLMEQKKYIWCKLNECKKLMERVKFFQMLQLVIIFRCWVKPQNMIGKDIFPSELHLVSRDPDQNKINFIVNFLKKIKILNQCT